MNFKFSEEEEITKELAAQILKAGTSFDRLRQSLSRVEDQLDALPPGHADEARLLRMRETFRILIRASSSWSLSIRSCARACCSPADWCQGIASWPFCFSLRLSTLTLMV